MLVSLTLISIIAAWADGQPQTCPEGTTQVGNYGADISGCGLTDCNSRYYNTNPTLGSTGPFTVDTCSNSCQSTSGCVAFNYAYYGQDQNHQSYTVCTLYNSDTPTGTWGATQVFCKIDADSDSDSDTLCPENTVQIGDEGDTINTGYTYQIVSAGMPATYCRDFCANQMSGVPCKAFIYDEDYYADDFSYGTNPALCLFFSTTDVKANPYGNPNQQDQVICALPAYASAKSPGLLNLDGVNIVNENGETMELSVYIIYAVIGLVLVNIICLMINCWKKCGKEGNGKRYKVVSMASTTDDECTDV